MCQLKVKVAVKGHILNKQILDIMSCPLYNPMIIPIMAGYPSNLAKKFSPTEQYPQHILPLLPLYNAQWWGYESLTAIVLVYHKSLQFLLQY